MARRREKNFGSIALTTAAGVAALFIIGGLSAWLLSKIFTVFDSIKSSPWNFAMIVIAFALFYIYVIKKR